MSSNFKGQPQNANLVLGLDGSGVAVDVSASNPLPVSLVADGYGPVPVSGTSPAGSSASGNPVQVGGVYNAAAPTPSTGQVEPLQLDSLGNLQSNLATKLAGEDLTNDVMKVEGQFSYTNITTATTTTVKSGAGLLESITINKAVASATVAIYDNTAGSGTLIGTVTMPATLLASQTVLFYSVKFNTGLTLVTVGAQDMTVAWR